MNRSGAKFLAAAATLAVVGGLGAGARAATMELKFADSLSPNSTLHKNVLVPWAERVAKESSGDLDVKVYVGPGITNLGNSYDRTINGVVDITWGILAPITTQFPKTNVVTLPFLARNGTEATMGLWAIYKEGLVADEWSKVHLLGVATFPGIYIHSKKPIRAMTDLKGVRISADSRWPSLALERLGATPVHMPVSELYQTAQRDTIDAIAIAWPAMLSFKLFEVTRYHLEVPLVNDVGFVSMNKESYARLPAAGKKAIDENSGDVLTKALLVNTLSNIKDARAFTAKQPDHVISQLDPADEARWMATAQPVIEEWEKTTPNAAAVLAAYNAEIKRVRDMEQK